MRGATGRVLRDLANGFAADGFDVTIITTASRAGRTQEDGIRILSVKGPEKPAYFVVYLWLWLKIFIAALKSGQTDLIITLTDPPFTVVMGDVLKRLKKAKHIHWCHDLYPDVFPALGVRLPAIAMRGLKKLTRAAMLRADKVVVIGRCMAARLSSAGFNAQQITFIPNWPDSELLNGGRQEIYTHGPGETQQGQYDEIANSYRSHDDQHKHGPKFRVLYAGNIGRAHPVDTILKAAEILHDPHPEIEFVFVGYGPRHDWLAKERARRHLDNIRLIPYQPASRLGDLMESGDVHLLSLRHAAVGMVVPVKLYTALAVGRPCIMIGPDNSEAAAVIKEFHVGSVVSQGKAELLAEEIRQMRMSSETWFSAHEGAKTAGQVYVPKQAIAAWIDRARSVLKAP